MSKAILGIDLGTSSVKVLLRYTDGRIQKARCTYEENTPSGWICAMNRALRTLELRDVAAVGLCAQTGTYIIDDTTVLGWGDAAGSAQLPLIRDAFSAEIFEKEIGMPHPAIVSYPLPRLCYIKQHFPNARKVRQPKDLLLHTLTGTDASDIWTWRGLAHPDRAAYSEMLLRAFDLDAALLPSLLDSTQAAGCVSAAAAAQTGLPAGTPVTVGLNDFFAGLVGMGIPTLSALFDVTGTSEHFGAAEPTYTAAAPVSGRFLQGFVRYGGTASAGLSLSFAQREFGLPEGDVASCLRAHPPIFLPYINGERAPIFDSNARGVFFGIGKDCTRAQMAYAVLEGVAFSLLHIAEQMGALPSGALVLGGGAAKDPLLGMLKATLLDRPCVTLCEPESSALGAAMLAGVGIGLFPDIRAATTACVQTDTVFTPDPTLRDTLLSRYAIYRSLYPALKTQFQALKEI